MVFRIISDLIPEEPRMRFTRFLPILTCALGLVSQSLLGQAVDWRFAQPQATLVGGVRLSALLQSPLLKIAMDQAAAKNPQAAMGLAVVQNLFHGVTEVRFSIVDNGTPTPDSLMLVSGELDPTTLAMLEGQPQSAGKMESFRVNANTVLLGTGASLKAAIARLGQEPADLHSAAFLRASQITPGHDLWIAGQVPNIPGIPLPAGFNLNLQGFAAGMSLRDSISLEIAADTGTAEQAEALAKLVRDAEAKQPATGTVRPEISVQGTTARLRVSVPADQVMEAMKNPALAGLMAGTPSTGLAPLPTLPPKPAKPSRGTVIIEGLEGGTLEIPIETPEARPGTVR